jgi:DNA-binding transcriptional LysR family regulator
MLRFNQYDQAIHAAIAGQGIALGRLELLAPMLADGRLEIVGGAKAPSRTHFSYWLIQAEASPRREVRDVMEWVLDGAGQAAASRNRDGAAAFA